MLKRAHLTIDTILTKIDLCEHNIHKDWRLNERHYGALTGLNKGKSSKQLNKTNRSDTVRTALDPLIASISINSN